MSLIEIIKALQSASGSNTKLSILQEHKDDELLKAYIKATCDPSISYYMTKLPKHGEPSGRQGCFDLLDIQHALAVFAGRMVTGKAAQKAMVKWLEDQNSVEDQELIKLLISRSVGAGVGDSMILKVWPTLYFCPPYERCSLMTEKIAEHFESLHEFIAQKKADGSFAYVMLPREGDATAFTRAGSYYPSWLVNKLIVGASVNSGDVVIVGEMLVVKDGKQLSRQTGNGIFNSILKGEDESSFAEYEFVMEAWNLLSISDFKDGYSPHPTGARLHWLSVFAEFTPNINMIETHYVKSLKEARAITKMYYSQGFEGSIYKTISSPWKDHTSPFSVKDKLAFEADYLITGVYEGKGKAAGMLGGINIETSDGKLKSNCGSGYSDDMRKYMWEHQEEFVGGVATIIANDVVSKKGSDVLSLFLPIYSDFRFDKKLADTLEQVYDQLSAAKGCKAGS